MYDKIPLCFTLMHFSLHAKVHKLMYSRATADRLIINCMLSRRILFKKQYANLIFITNNWNPDDIINRMPSLKLDKTGSRTLYQVFTKFRAGSRVRIQPNRPLTTRSSRIMVSSQLPNKSIITTSSRIIGLSSLASVSFITT